MNKTGGNAIRLKLINLQTALKKLADKHHRKVCISWNQLFFWKSITVILQMPLHSFCFVLNRLAIYISLALKLLSKQNKIFRQRQNYEGRFSNKVPAGGRLYKKG